MGVLNVTPDSFSDGAKYHHLDLAAKRALQMIEEGVDIIDIGGESTRPGASEVELDEELKRVVPLIEKIAPLGVPISIDTSKPEVMRAAINAGAHMVNDVRALQENGAIDAVAELGCPVCLMHMQGQPRTMQNNPEYIDVVEEVADFLAKRITACTAKGIDKDLICVDPGFGFGKSLAHNLSLLNNLSHLEKLGVPVLAGMSRKSMLGQITGKDVNERLAASLAVALIAMQNGAKIIRVHDVKETVDVRNVYLAALSAN